MQDLLLRFVHAFMVQSSHAAIAAGRARIDERLARGLLMWQDRLGVDEWLVTHEFLALLMGVRRQGVTVGLHELEGKGLIRSVRNLRSHPRPPRPPAYGKRVLRRARRRIQAAIPCGLRLRATFVRRITSRACVPLRTEPAGLRNGRRRQGITSLLLLRSEVALVGFIAVFRTLGRHLAKVEVEGAAAAWCWPASRVSNDAAATGGERAVREKAQSRVAARTRTLDQEK